MHRPSTSANKLVATVKPRAELDSMLANDGRLEDLDPQSRNGMPSTKTKSRVGDSSTRFAPSDSLNAIAARSLIQTGPVSSLAGNLGQPPTMQRRPVSKHRQSHALEGASMPSPFADEELHSVVPKAVPPSAFALAARGGSGI